MRRKALLLASALAMGALPALAQVSPTYNPASIVSGQKNLNERHQACIWVQPEAGDYTRYDADVDPTTGATRVCLPAVVIVDADGEAAAKQPALGTAGTPSADVISVQGVASGTPLRVTSVDTNDVPVVNGATDLDVIVVGGFIDVGSIASGLPAGTNNIGDVDVVSLPALPAGTNTIGNVLPAELGAGGTRAPLRLDTNANLRSLLVGNLTSPNSTNKQFYTEPMRVDSTSASFPLAVGLFASDGTQGDSVVTIQGALTANTGVLAVATAPAAGVRISTNSTVNGIKTGAGSFEKVCVGVAGSGSNVLTLYDNTTATGTVLAVIDTQVSRCLEYNLRFATGLSAILGTGTAADLILTYR